MSQILEFFGYSTARKEIDWEEVVRNQQCFFLKKKCYKVRKSNPNISIGTCSVLYGSYSKRIIICPARLLEFNKVFVDCFHLLTTHEPGNDFHIVTEISIPGGSVDYFLVSTKNEKVKDFVGIELQALDTTGTVWPERQRLLKELNIPCEDNTENSERKFGMNWKMTAKTILVQMHHKAKTFEHVNKKLILILQDSLFSYMKKEFKFDHLNNPARIGDSIHIHTYMMLKLIDNSYKLSLQNRLSTDSDGVATCLGLNADAEIQIEEIYSAIQAKLSAKTLFIPIF
jgi:hypothetical protein